MKRVKAYRTKLWGEEYLIRTKGPKNINLNNKMMNMITLTSDQLFYTLLKHVKSQLIQKNKTKKGRRK